MSKSPSPSKPNIQQIHQDARALSQAHMRGDQSVCARVREFSPRFAQASDAAILAASGSIDAIEVVARERGFQSWHAAQEADAGQKLLSGNANLEHLKKQAKKLLKAYQAGDRSAVERVGEHHDGEEFTLNNAQFVVAREYGFASWPKLMGNFMANSEIADGRLGFNRPQLFGVERMHGECERQLGEVFSRHLDEKAMCDMAFTDQTTYGEFIHSLARPSCMCTFAVDAMQCRSVLDIAMPLTFALLGKGDGEERWLSEGEQERMEPVFGDIMASLQRAWEPVLPAVVGQVEIETDPERVKVVEAQAFIVLIAFEINTLERSGLVSIAYPQLNGIYELREHFTKSN